MRGFTVLEMVVVTLILAVFLTSLLFIFSVTNQSWSGGNTVIDLRQEIIRAMMTMDRELRLTKPTKTNLNIGVPRTSVTFSPPAFNATTGDILLNTTTGNIVWSSNPVSYSRNASNVLIRTSGAQNSTLGNNITSLQFNRTTDKQIEIDITAQKYDNSGRLINDTERTIIKMRN